jgi:hypothetical protein
VNGKAALSGCTIPIYLTVSKAHEDVLKSTKQPVPPPYIGTGLIDTGAMMSCIDPQVVKRLRLVPTGRMNVLTPSTGATPHATLKYDVSMHIFEPKSNYMLSRAVAVAESELQPQGLDAIIGMDVLSHCLLIVDGTCGEFKLGI